MTILKYDNADKSRIFGKSIMLLVAAHLDKDAQPYRWHITSHSAFQAIMHILSELKTPEFSVSEYAALRDRAFRALRQTRKLRENESSQTWNVVRKQIDRTIPPDFATRIHSGATDPIDPESLMLANAQTGRNDHAHTSAELLTNYDAGRYNSSTPTAVSSNELSHVDLDLQDLTGEFDWACVPLP